MLLHLTKDEIKNLNIWTEKNGKLGLLKGQFFLRPYSSISLTQF